MRNRRVVALLGLWKLKAEYQYFADAVEEAKVAVAADHPHGTDVIARFCLARESLRNADVDPESVIRGFAEAGGQKASGPVLAAAALLALDVADRKLHEDYRRAYLDEYAEHPAFFLDRYHRYWMCTTRRSSRAGRTVDVRGISLRLVSRKMRTAPCKSS